MERWVSEVNAGWGLTVKVREQLCDIQSQFQHIEIFETKIAFFKKICYN